MEDFFFGLGLDTIPDKEGRVLFEKVGDKLGEITLRVYYGKEGVGLG